MGRKPKGYWNDFEKCKAEGQKYSSRGEWHWGSRGSYMAAWRNGWLDEIIPESYQTVARGHWTFENCKAEVQKYSSRSEWKRNSQGSYNAALKNGWLDQIIPESRQTVPPGHWTFENCMAEGQKYSSRGEWHRNSQGSYYAALKNGWLDQIIPESRQTVPRGHWTFENCMAEGQKYSSRGEWHRNSPSSYNAALKNGWLDQIIPESNYTVPRGHWTFENCKAEGQKYSSRSEWKRNSQGSYMAAWRNGWLDEIIPESYQTVARGHWDDFENCKVEGQKYSSREEWKRNSPSSYNAALKNGWLDQIIPEFSSNASDNDAVYLYEFEYAGVRLHKIGLTSIRRNTGRIEETMAKAGCTATNVILWHVEDARDIERKMLEVGRPQDLYKGDGFTEMRILTPQEQRRVMRIAGDACISDPVYIERVP